MAMSGSGAVSRRPRRPRWPKPPRRVWQASSRSKTTLAQDRCREFPSNFYQEPKVGSGAENQFRLPTLSVRRPFGEATFAGPHGSGRDAPIPVVRISEEDFVGFSYV